MKTTVKIILRSLAATPLKIALVYAGVIFLLRFEFSPLPEWTGDVVGYLIHFSAAYFLAWWVLHKRSARKLDGFVVAFCFTIISGILELALAGLLLGPSTQLFLNFLTWQSLLVNLVYLIGVACAWIQVRMSLTQNDVSPV